jgi:hypothetical protein
LVVLGAGTIPGRAAWLRDAGAGDGPVDQQGWQLHFFSEHTAIQAFPSQPLM